MPSKGISGKLRRKREIMPTIKTFYNNGVLKSIKKIYPNGRPYGIEKHYYKNGQIRFKCKYNVSGNISHVEEEYDLQYRLTVKKIYYKSPVTVKINKYNEAGKVINSNLVIYSVPRELKLPPVIKTLHTRNDKAYQKDYYLKNKERIKKQRVGYKIYKNIIKSKWPE